MFLQGREGDGPVADQVHRRQAWIGGRIRGMVFITARIPLLEALLFASFFFVLLVCTVSMHLSLPTTLSFRWVLFLYVLFPFFFLCSSHLAS